MLIFDFEYPVNNKQSQLPYNNEYLNVLFFYYKKA